jgi:hypothetical protein
VRVTYHDDVNQKRIKFTPIAPKAHIAMTANAYDIDRHHASTGLQKKISVSSIPIPLTFYFCSFNRCENYLNFSI